MVAAVETKVLAVDACLMKFNEHTGLHMWAVDVPTVAVIVP